MGFPFLQRLPYTFLHRIQVRKYFMIPESHNAEPALLQASRSLMVIESVISMLSAIDLDN